MPLYIIAQPKLAKMNALGCRAIEAPAPQMVFGNIDRGHRPNQDIVQRHRYRSCNFVASIRAQWSAACRRLPSRSCGVRPASASFARVVWAIATRKQAQLAAVARAASILDYPLVDRKSRITRNKAMRGRIALQDIRREIPGSHPINGAVMLSEAKHLCLFPLRLDPALIRDSSPAAAGSE